MKRLWLLPVLLSTICCGFSAQAQTSAAPTVGAQPSAKEIADYNGAANETDPEMKAVFLEMFTTQYPQSSLMRNALLQLMYTYGAIDQAKSLSTADRVLAIDPNNLSALIYEVVYRRAAADSLADPAARLAALAPVVNDASLGLVLTFAKPDDMPQATFDALIKSGTPVFWGAVGDAALLRKDGANAITAFTNELKAVPLDDSPKPSTLLLDTFYLGLAYSLGPPPDYARCAYYTARAASFESNDIKGQMLPTAQECYRTAHGSDSGFDAVLSTAHASLDPPAGFSIAPPPPNELVASSLATTDLDILSIEEAEFVLQFGTAADAASVWKTLKDKPLAIPSALVVESSPTALRVAVADEAHTGAPDYTFALSPGSPWKFAHGSKVAISGTYDSYASAPFMFFMRDATITQHEPLPVLQASAAATPAVPSHEPVPAASNAPTQNAPASASAPARGFASDPPPDAGKSATPVPIPHNYALIFATSDYAHWPHLENPIPDADTLSQTLQTLYSFQIDEIRNPTNDQIVAKLREYLHHSFEPQDQLLIVFTGHGFFDPDLLQGYIVPTDGELPAMDLGHHSLLAHSEIMEYVDRIPSKHIVLMMDACFAGTLDRKIAESGLRGDPSIAMYAPAPLPQLLQNIEPLTTRRYLASGGKDFVPDGLPGHHSPFMAALLATLTQSANFKGYATLEDIQQGLYTVMPQPRWGDIQGDNGPGADFLLLTPVAVRQIGQSK